jgi:hypothetical protein
MVGDRTTTVNVTKTAKGNLQIPNSPCILYAASARATRKDLTIVLTSGTIVIVPTKSLGKPWADATQSQLSNLILEAGGSTLWWEDLDEGFELDEALPSMIGFKPASLLARKGRGRKASIAKASAARKNGAKGGRPRKQARSA